jgi:hypothetical protein
MEAFEAVVGGDDAELILQPKQVVIQLVDQIRCDHILDHRPSIGSHALGVPLDGGVVESPGVSAD